MQRQPPRNHAINGQPSIWSVLKLQFILQRPTVIHPQITTFDMQFARSSMMNKSVCTEGLHSMLLEIQSYW